MKYCKSLGAVALSVLVFLVLPTGTWAASLTSPTGTVATPTIEGASEGAVTFDSGYYSGVFPVPCTWSFSGEVKTHGEGKPVSIPLTSLTITSCGGGPGWHMTAASLGSLSITGTTGYDGTVSWSGATIEMTWGSLQCRYKTENTHIGTFTGGDPGTIDLEGSLIFDGGGFPCEQASPQARPLTGSIKVEDSKGEGLFIDTTDTRLTSPTGTVSTPTIKAESEGHVGIDHPLATFQCQWSLEGTVKGHGGNAVVPLSSLATSGCTDSWHATTIAAGKLEISSTSEYNGTVTWSGGTVEMTRLGTTCRYKSADTHLGTLTGGSPATMHIEGNLPFHSGSSLCGTEAYPLTGSYKVTSPGGLYVDKAI